MALASRAPLALSLGLSWGAFAGHLGAPLGTSELAAHPWSAHLGTTSGTRLAEAPSLVHRRAASVRALARGDRPALALGRRMRAGMGRRVSTSGMSVRRLALTSGAGHHRGVRSDRRPR